MFLGARFSSRAPDYLIRPSLVTVLLVSGLKLIGTSNTILSLVVPIAVAGGISYALWSWRRARQAIAARAAGSETQRGRAPGR